MRRARTQRVPTSRSRLAFEPLEARELLAADAGADWWATWDATTGDDASWAYDESWNLDDSWVFDGGWDDSWGVSSDTEDAWAFDGSWSYDDSWTSDSIAAETVVDLGDSGVQWVEPAAGDVDTTTVVEDAIVTGPPDGVTSADVVAPAWPVEPDVAPICDAEIVVADTVVDAEGDAGFDAGIDAEFDVVRDVIAETVDVVPAPADDAAEDAGGIETDDVLEVAAPVADDTARWDLVVVEEVCTEDDLALVTESVGSVDDVVWASTTDASVTEWDVACEGAVLPDVAPDSEADLEIEPVATPTSVTSIDPPEEAPVRLVAAATVADRAAVRPSGSRAFAAWGALFFAGNSSAAGGADAVATAPSGSQSGSGRPRIRLPFRPIV